MREVPTESGRLLFTESVIGAIAAAAALACSGVVSVIASRLGTELAEMLGRSEPGHAADVLLEQDRLEITVRLVVAYGVSIPKVAAAVEAAVTQAVITQAGFRPDVLRIRVQGVRRLSNPWLPSDVPANLEGGPPE